MKMSIMWALAGVCLAALSGAEGYLLQATMHWERVGMTPQFVKASALGVYNGPCGIYSREYALNPNCGDLAFGVLATPLISQSGYPRRYLMKLTLNLVIDRELWTAKSVTKPSRGTTWPHGTLCRDTLQSTEKTGNCYRDNGNLLNHFVVNETKSGWNVMQFTELFDYDPGGISTGLWPTLADVPVNVTWGFNYTELVYPRCDTQTVTVNPPTCYCATQKCTPASEGAVGTPKWTLESAITFSSDNTTFVDGVTPVTDNHSPRFTVPPIVYVPHMLIDENVSFPITAVDEDGATRVQYLYGGEGVAVVTTDGMVTVPPLFFRLSGGMPANLAYTKNTLFKARIKAVDPVLPNAALSTTISFMIKSCDMGGPVPLNTMPDGSGLWTKRGGHTTPVFVTLGEARCAESSGLMATPMITDRITCLGLGKTWEPVWIEPPQTLVQCELGLECMAKVEAVQIDFSATSQCWWSGRQGGTRCSSLVSADLGVVMDYDLISANGEHTAWPDSTSFQNPGVVRVYPFAGRAAGRAANPLPYVADIGRMETFCLAARNNATDSRVSDCWSVPHCVTVAVQDIGQSSHSSPNDHNASYPPWLIDSGNFAAHEKCRETRSWEEIMIDDRASPQKHERYTSGGLGALRTPSFGLWVCWLNHPCVGAVGAASSDRMCFVRNQVTDEWHPWGLNSVLKLCEPAPTLDPEETGCSMSGFFDPQCVEYPANYSYPDTYTTRELSSVNGYSDGDPSYSTVDFSGTMSGGYTGAVLTPNGNVIFVPRTASTVAVFNPSNRTFLAVDISGFAMQSLQRYDQGVLAPNGKVIFVPHGSSNVGVFDTANNAFEVVDISSFGSVIYYVGGVLAPTGKIYFVPFHTNDVGVFDPETYAFSVVDISSTISTNSKFSGGVLAPNGKIIFPPYSANKVGVFDPSTNAFMVVDISSTISGNAQFFGGVLTPDGKIVFSPHNADKVVVFDPSDNTFTSVDISGSISSDFKYAGGVLAPNGKVIFAPWNADNVGIFDPSTSTFSVFRGLSASSGKFDGAVVAQNGKVIFVPTHANYVGMFDPGNSEPAYTVSGGVPQAWRTLLSPYHNKF